MSGSSSRLSLLVLLW
uniref:Uncharacterized protein n=1 Tax=Arundo donax TaxID=35708 RepID=A0A0A9C385_ARUDO